MRKNWIIWTIAIGLFWGCNQDQEAKLPSVEERTFEAIKELNDALTEPTNGWKLAYRPTDQTGTFLILLKFNDDGTVRLQSDLEANGGEFRDQTIPYRIDSSQGLELIMETFAVFHYLFELEQTTFGGEFEFVFVEEEDGNLLFRSKSDFSPLTFEPASSTDSNLISTEAINILSRGIFQRQNLGGIGEAGNFNFYIPATDHTLSVTFNLQSRVLKLLGIAKGQDMEAILAANTSTSLNRQTSFSLSDEKVVLDEPQTFTFDGTSYEIDEIPVGSFSKVVESFCTSQQDSLARFTGTSNLGDFIATSSPFQTSNGFQPNRNNIFGINHAFLFDQNDNSLATQIEAVFPNAVAFQWYHGFDIQEDSLLNAVGFVTVDQFNNAEFFLRRFEVEQRGNFLQMAFTGENFITLDNPTQEQLDGLENLTNEIFSDGDIYVMEMINLDGLLEFYNPCNKYKGFMFIP